MVQCFLRGRNESIFLCLSLLPGLLEASVSQGGEQHLLQSQQQVTRGGPLQTAPMGFQGPPVTQHGVQAPNPALPPPPAQNAPSQHTHLSPHTQHLQSTPPPPNQASHPWAPPTSHPLSSPPLTPQKVPHVQVSLRPAQAFDVVASMHVSTCGCVSGELVMFFFMSDWEYGFGFQYSELVFCVSVQKKYMGWMDFGENCTASTPFPIDQKCHFQPALISIWCDVTRLPSSFLNHVKISSDQIDSNRLALGKPRPCENTIYACTLTLRHNFAVFTTHQNGSACISRSPDRPTVCMLRWVPSAWEEKA